jgi:hypothetical protein
MKLNVKALAYAASIFWGALVFCVALAEKLWGYGVAFLQIMDSLYPGYHIGAGWWSVVVATLYALLDGLVAGALLGWLYNRCVDWSQTRE